MADGVSKCGRKTALSIFFALILLGYIFCLLSLLSPSWQYVYLENGRTEHHHGLWLDCKRDYSFDYGRPREYYETLWRRDLEGSPFALFYLPPLQCVYKFDYYIDPEDLYDHDHDENRIQNDAYQHLFLGWKIAALAGVGVSVCFAGSAILLGICSFCHRTFICACTVLITIAAILSTLGIVIFYAWANYQDNKVIKEEEDTIYEQKLGYAFYFQIVGCAIFWFSSMVGCCVTSISLGKSRGAKLVKIEVVEGDDSLPLNSTHNSSQPFKRSFSAIYRVNSSALRQMEKKYLRQNKQQAMDNNFKRTASVPNFSKKQQKQERLERKKNRQSTRSSMDFFSSTSNITEITHAGSNITLNTHQTAATAPAPLVPITPKPALKSALKTPKSSRRTLDDTDPTYDYLAPSSIGVSSFLGGNSPPKKSVYDEVYESIGQEEYLTPNSVKERSNLALNKDAPPARRALLPSLPVNGSSQSIPSVPQKTTLIDDVARPSSVTEVKPEKPPDARRIHERLTIEDMSRLERFKKISKSEVPSVAPPKPPMTIRDFGIDLSKSSTGVAEISKPTHQPVDTSGASTPLKYASLKNTGPHDVPPPGSSLQYMQIASHRKETSVDDFPDPPPGITLNTFGESGRASQRSITNLAFRSDGAIASHIFDRPDSVSSKRSEKKAPLSLHRQLLTVVPDEVDRSVGSSTQFENDTLSEAASYVQDANIRLNLFMNDKKKPSQDETTV